MTNARIERMTRELKAEPAEQFFEGLFSLVARLWPKAEVRPRASLTLQSVR